MKSQRMTTPWVLLICGLLGCGEVVKSNPDAAVTPDADPCTGVCECRVDTDCSAVHTGCNDQGTSRTCECVAGYTKNLAGACEFSGIVVDPGFQSLSAWNPNAAAIDVNLNEAGMIEPGAARFTGMAGMCTLPRVTQQLSMPKYSRAEPMVARLTYRTRDPGFFGAPTPAFGIGGSWQDNLTESSAYTTARFCLGAGHFAAEASTGLGADKLLELMPGRLPAFTPCADPNVGIDIDRFDIVVANPNECPAPGTAINGDVESMGGWVLAGSSANGNPFSTTFEPNIGEANSRAVRLFTRNRCSNVSAANGVSVPSADAVASPALSYFNKTTATLTGVDTDFSLGQVALPSITASGSAITRKVCMPAFMRGGVFSFRAAMNLSGTCADQVNAESIIDSLKVINEPSCGTDPAITDPGFESSLELIGAQSTPGKSLARTLTDPAQAHTGNGVLQMSVMQLCSGASWSANVVVPVATGGAGPALFFFYKATPANRYTFSVSSAGSPTFAPTLDNTYHEGKLCLDPKLAGRNQVVNFGMNGGSGTCATTHPPETGFVDDLRVTTDASCPAM